MKSTGARSVAGAMWAGRAFGAILTVGISLCADPLKLLSASETSRMWRPGLDGGIPHRASVHTVTDFGAISDDGADDSFGIQAAIDALPAGGGAVLIPPGIYHLSRELYLPGGTVLRGSGAAHTSLLFNLPPDESLWAIAIVTYEDGDWTEALSGFASGSTEIWVADPSGFRANRYAEIEQQNDPELMFTDPRWNTPWAQNAVGEILRVDSVLGNRIRLRKPLNTEFRRDLNPRIRPKGMVEEVGLEDLRIERIDDGDGYSIYITNASRVWVRGVESAMSFRSHVHAERVYECEVRESYFHHAHDYGGGGHGYGVALTAHTTGCLVEDNIFTDLRHSMLVSLGANGNVYGYNYSRDPRSSEWWGYTPNDISLHGHYPSHNLFEGNVTQHIAAGDFWGPAGPGNTLLRNCVQDQGIWIYDQSHGQTVLGNVVQGPAGINVEDSVQNTMIHGNWLDGTIQLDPSWNGEAAPSSLYHPGPPWFMTTSPWPPIGGDHAPSCGNPAASRWEAGLATPRSTSTRVFGDGLETGDLRRWSRAVGSPH